MTIALRRTILLVLAALAALTIALAPTAAMAAEANPTVELVDDGAPAILSIAFAPTWVQLLTLLVTIVLPVLVGLVTTRETNSNRKTIYLVLLSAVTGFGSELLSALSNGQTYDAAAGLFTAVASLVVGIALHYGVWKPTGVAAAAASVGYKPKH